MGWSCAGAMLVASSAVFAQTNDDALRRDLVAQAEQARDSGDHARALDLSSHAAQIRMTPSLALLIAQEHEQLGHVVDALDYARRCVSDASRDGTLHNRQRITRNCRELVTSLSSQVARVTIRLAAREDSATVRVGTQTIPPAAWGVPVPVDPGEVNVTASSPDGRRFAQTVRATRGGVVEVEVVLTMPTASNVSEVPPVVGPAPAPESAAVVAPTPLLPGRRAAVGAGPWIVVGVGAASLIAAGVLWSMHVSAVADRDAACDRGGCLPAALDSDATARDFTVGTNIAIGLGGAAIAGGLTWFFVARTGGTESSALRPSAWLLPGGAGLTLGGTL